MSLPNYLKIVFDTFPRSHLENAHRILQCERCYKSFNDHDGLNEHRLAESCPQNSDERKEGLDDKQMEKIKELEPMPKKRGISSRERLNLAVEKWFAIWDILFPGVDKPANPCKSESKMCAVS